MKKRIKSLEPPQMRAERLQLSKCMQPRVINNKKKFNKKRERQQVSPFSIGSFSVQPTYIMV